MIGALTGGPFPTQLDRSFWFFEVIVVKIPTSYKEGYLKGRSIDPDLADNYVAHTTVGDPLSPTQRWLNSMPLKGMSPHN